MYKVFRLFLLLELCGIVSLLCQEEAQARQIAYYTQAALENINYWLAFYTKGPRGFSDANAGRQTEMTPIVSFDKLAHDPDAKKIKSGVMENLKKIRSRSKIFYIN